MAEGEIDAKTMCAKFAHVSKDGDQTYQIDIYNLEIVISDGYRVHSLRGVEFCRWATKPLYDYIVCGYVVNRHRRLLLTSNLKSKPGAVINN